jgi:hypothetical protein
MSNDLDFGEDPTVPGYNETPEQLASTERTAALTVRDFMTEHGIDTLRIDDENRTPSYALGYDDEDLDDGVAWMPRSVISNPTAPAWNPVVTLAALNAYLG